MADPSSAVQQLLLQEAQAQVATLRTELHVARRVAEERRQAQESLVKSNEGLKQQLAELQAQHTHAQQQLHTVPALRQEITSLQSTLSSLQRELELGVKARRILESELAQERAQRASVEESKAALQAERAHLLKAKDDLAASLRVAQRKAEEAEEEQLRAEEEAATLRYELKALQAGLAEGATGLSTPTDYPTSQYHSRHASEVPALTNGSTGHPSDALVLQLQAQVDEERDKGAVLMTSLQESKSENLRLRHELDAMQQSVRALQSQNKTLQQDLHSLQHANQQGGDQDSGNASNGQVGRHGPLHAHPDSQQGMDGSWRDSSAEHSAVTQHHQHQSSTNDDSDQVAQLQAQVSKLKASRDKLLEQIDRQWEEMDRLATDNRGLADEVERLQHIALGWEAQAQGSLAAEERLKEMLEEAAGWGSVEGGKRNGNGAAQSDLLQAKARAAELELQVRALAAELLRSQQASLSFGKAVLPTLSGVELRLNRMLDARRSIQSIGMANVAQRSLLPSPAQ